MEEDFCLELVRKKRSRPVASFAEQPQRAKAAPEFRADLTDESCSSSPSPRDENSSARPLRRLGQCRSEKVVRLRRLETEEESPAAEAPARGSERRVEAREVQAQSPARERDSEPSESRSPRAQPRRDLGCEFEAKGASEKKVPLAPRNKTKIMFNFDKGYLADRSDRSGKPPGPGAGVPQPSMTDQLTLRIACLKQNKKAPARMALDLELCEKEAGNATTTLCRTNRDDGAIQLEERLREKDLVIEQLRREVDVLNVKNESLINEVFDLRVGMERLQSQLNLLMKAQGEPADGRAGAQPKQASKTQPDQPAPREAFAFGALLAKEKPLHLGQPASKFSSAKKASQTSSAAGAFKRPGVMMLTPKGINKISFHSKSTPR